jgi:hypothetical protein
MRLNASTIGQKSKKPKKVGGRGAKGPLLDFSWGRFGINPLVDGYASTRIGRSVLKSTLPLQRAPKVAGGIFGLRRTNFYWLSVLKPGLGWMACTRFG